MSWLRLLLLPALIGVGALVLTPSQADAQKGGGKPSGGARPAGSASPSGARPSVNRYPNPYPYRGPSYGYGLGYPYNSIYFGGGYGSFASPFYYDRFGPGPYYSYNPPIYSNIELYYPQPTIIPTPLVNNAARIEVRLPAADAQFTLNGSKTVTTGAQRVFDTPALEPGYTYSYQVVATWMQDGQPVRVERTIEVAPGRTTLVDFTTANTQPRMREVDD